MTADEFPAGAGWLSRPELDVLIATRDQFAGQIKEIDRRLAKNTAAIGTVSAQLRRPDATAGHSKRMWKLTKERNTLLAEKERIESELNDIRTQTTTHGRLVQSSYASNQIARAFLVEAEQQLEPQLFQQIKQAAIHHVRLLRQHY